MTRKRPVADDPGERAELVDAGRELVKMQLGGIDGLAVEVEVVEDEGGRGGGLVGLRGQRQHDIVAVAADEAGNGRLVAGAAGAGVGGNVDGLLRRRLGASERGGEKDGGEQADCLHYAPQQPGRAEFYFTGGRGYGVGRLGGMVMTGCFESGRGYTPLPPFLRKFPDR